MYCGTAALFMLPESPRWLVVNGQLDAALLVMHCLYASGPSRASDHQASTEASTAKVCGGNKVNISAVVIRLQCVVRSM